MSPILFKLGSFTLYSYGLLMAVGVLVGLSVMTHEAKRYRWNVDQITRLYVFTFLMGLVGSRVVYVMTRLNEPNADILAMLFNLRAGFVYYGGLIASWLYLVWYIKRHRLPTWAVSDVCSMAICLGLAVGRVGCTLGGCCYGSPTDMPWGIVMEKEAALGPLHPVQMYEAIFLVAIFVGFWIRRKTKAYDGEITVWFVGSYAVARFILEIYRGDLVRGFLVDDIMSTSQFISLPLLAVAVLLHFRLRKKPVLKPAIA